MVAMLLPSALSLAFPNEAPNAVRAVGVIGPAFLLAALPLPLIRRSLFERVFESKRRELFAVLRVSPTNHHQPEPGHAFGHGGASEVRWSIPLQGGYLFAVLVVLLLAWEGISTYQTYFRDYVYYQPGHNYSISLEMAQAIDDFAADGPAYIKVWPFWYDGDAVRTQLRVQSQNWAGEIAELDPNKPPLSTLQGKALFILHPEDQEALATLRAVFPHGIALERRDFEEQLAFITFYGER
jgi:hypothetical protein